MTSQNKDTNGSNGKRPLDISLDFKEPIPPILLLKERLVVDIEKRKVGEIVVRKEVITQIIEIPIRRERLIVEQISPEYKQIAIVDLDSNTSSVKINEDSNLEEKHTVKGEFNSVQMASEFLEAIAHLCEQIPEFDTSIKIEINAKDTTLQKTYQELLNNFLNQSS